jgi:hypothetical protein
MSMLKGYPLLVLGITTTSETRRRAVEFGSGLGERNPAPQYCHTVAYAQNMSGVKDPLAHFE